MESSDAVSVVALIISVVALIGTILQLLQQYFSSAEGYSNCGEQVMGPWALHRVRKFRFTELRFEVLFEVPVMFICPPSNKSGPVRNQKLLFVDGTLPSEAETRTPSLEAEKAKKEEQKESKMKSTAVHTADNDRANWFVLLQAFHAMEKTSRLWQTEKLKRDKAALGPGKTGAYLPEAIAPWTQHSVVMALQPKKKSWDTMPAEVKKPYATSAICHIVEMAAMLGLHWRDFDRAHNKYHAEGNGYTLTGQNVDDLGIMFHFQIYAANKFDSNRVIPNESIKRLAFGDVLTIFRPDAEDKSRADYDDDDPKSTGMMHLGSTTELVETLTSYGCNVKTTDYFRDDRMKHGHLFPIVFEILGMIGESVYLPNTYYRFLPNPTTFSWNRKNFSLRNLILNYRKNLHEDHSLGRSNHMRELHDWADALMIDLSPWADKNDFPLALLTCLHETIEKCDVYLNSTAAIKKMVLGTLRTHVQEVMKLLNDTHTAQDDSDDDSDESTLSSKDRAPTFEDINSAPPEERERKLMEIYFRTVRPAVAKNRPSLKKRPTDKYVPSVKSRSDVDLSLSDNDDDDVRATPAPRASTPQLFVSSSESEKPSAGAHQRPLPEDMEQELGEEVWCTLVLRMLCWLLLHDFHKKDIQISKSELFGSRLPVYIA